MPHATHILAACCVCQLLVLSAPPLRAEGSSDVKPCHGLAMHGDLKYGPDFEHFDYVNPDAPVGGTLYSGAMGTFDSFNPFILQGQEAAGSEMIYDTLLAGSDDEPFSAYGLLAETLEVPEDRSWVIFKLRKEARWHDGKPVTAEDVVFSFNILTSKGHPRFQIYYASVDKAEVLAPHRVKFTFKPGVVNRELPLIMGQLAVLPKHYWENKDFSQKIETPPIGSGPYKVEKFEMNRFVTYRRDPNYWGKDLPVRRGTINIDRHEISYYKDANVIFEAFMAGKIDIRPEYNSKNWATQYTTSAVKNGLIIKRRFEHERPQGMQAFAFNTRREIFKDERVREAMACAFDFEWSNKDLFYGQYVRCRSYFGNSELEAKGLPEGEELKILKDLAAKHPGAVAPEVLTGVYTPPSTGTWETERDHERAMRRNLAQGRKLLRAAGWSIRKSDKLLVNPDIKGPDGTPRPMEFEILLVQPAFERITLPFTKNLERLGIKATVRTVEPARYIERRKNYDYDMIVQSWGQSMSPGNEQRQMWSSTFADQPGNYNFVGIKNPAIDEAVELLISAPDRESLVIRTHVLDRLLQWGHYVIPQWYIGYDRYAYWDRFGMPDVIPMKGVNSSYWWIDPVKDAALKKKRQK